MAENENIGLDELVLDAANESDKDESKEPDVPVIGSEEWHKYFMSHLTEKELFQGNPTTDGLRRVFEILVGDIINSVSKTVQAPNRANEHMAVVEHMLAYEKFGDDRLRVVQEIADVYPGNTDPQYAKFASATASTRAEGRALRKAARLHKIVVAEELTDVASDFMFGIEEKITLTQQRGIDVIAKRSDVNMVKYFASIKTKYNFKNLADCPNAIALKALEHLNKYQSDEEVVPEQYKGYVENWAELV